MRKSYILMRRKWGAGQYNSNSTTKWHFTAYERDSESGNDHATFRYHVNRLGRFSSVDPVRPRGVQPQSFNRYAYVASDPIDRKDPRGLMYLDYPGGPVPVDSAGCPYDSALDALLDYGIGIYEYMSDFPGCPTTGAGGGGVGCSDGANCGGGGGGFTPPAIGPVLFETCTCTFIFPPPPTNVQGNTFGCVYECECPSGPTLAGSAPKYSLACFLKPCPLITRYERILNTSTGIGFGEFYDGVPPWCGQ